MENHKTAFTKQLISPISLCSPGAISSQSSPCVLNFFFQLLISHLYYFSFLSLYFEEEYRLHQTLLTIHKRLGYLCLL